VDQHYKRDLLFKEGSDHFKFYNATINAGYRVKPQIKLFAEGTFTYFPNKKTSTSMVNYVTGESQSLGMGSAGFSNRNFIFALGVQYSGMAS
jgi:outer membrane protease